MDVATLRGLISAGLGIGLLPPAPARFAGIVEIKELDIGTFRNSALILVSDDFAGFHFDINGIFSEQTKGILRRGQFGQTLSISHPLGRLTVAGELWHFTQPLTSRNAVGNLWAVSMFFSVLTGHCVAKLLYIMGLCV
jgi:hypothetical protein